VGLVLGTLRLPAILLLSGDASGAAGTNIGISAASAAAGGYRHSREGRVDRRVVAWMTPPSILGAIAGALLTDELPTRLLLAAIAAILAWNGLDLLLRPIRGREAVDPRLAPAVFFGFLIGVLGGAVGVILGTLRMPALLRGVGLTAHRAVGTNLVIGFALGLVALVTHAVLGNVEWRLLMAGVAGALPGGWLGARLTGRISEEKLRRAIGIALVTIAVAFAVEVVR
jgi:uncharacterized membrane protein YfcA